ncbi:MAG TPA: DUF1656 domain-containing protein [Terriglobia bacterium]|nr:DUF1656 domain-containing protein [Terriglobia bacterium]
MLTESNIGGVYMAPIVIYGLAASMLFLALRWLLTRLGFWRLVWHPGLFELGLFISILSVLVMVFP